MSDRIAVMSEGKIQQLGAPLEIYEQPVNRFVADFIGDTNFVTATIDGRGGRLCALPLRRRPRPAGAARSAASRTARSVTLAMRPEKILLKPAATWARSRRPSMSAPTPTTRCASATARASTCACRTPSTAAAQFAVGDGVGIDVPAGAARMLQD